MKYVDTTTTIYYYYYIFCHFYAGHLQLYTWNKPRI